MQNRIPAADTVRRANKSKVSKVVDGATSAMSLEFVVGRWVWWVGVVVLVLWVLGVGEEGRSWEVTPPKTIANKKSPGRILPPPSACWYLPCGASGGALQAEARHLQPVKLERLPNHLTVIGCPDVVEFSHVAS